jgi:hypothetical protein
VRSWLKCCCASSERSLYCGVGRKSARPDMVCLIVGSGLIRACSVLVVVIGISVMPLRLKGQRGEEYRNQIIRMASDQALI